MKLIKEEFRKVASEMLDNPVLSWFEKTFCELYCRADKENFERLIKAFPETIEKIKKSSKLIE